MCLKLDIYGMQSADELELVQDKWHRIHRLDQG